MGNLRLEDMVIGDFYTINYKKCGWRKPSGEFTQLTWSQFTGRFLKANGEPMTLKFEVSARFIAVVAPTDILTIEKAPSQLHPNKRPRDRRGRLRMPKGYD